MGVLLKLAPVDQVPRLSEINGQPEVISYINHRPHSVVTLDTTDDQVGTIHVITNPEKLKGVTSI
ncbi:MAG: hypothetical protein L0226_09855 [Acidobacteria bacterium]|nr:hypothetical protein [Acidobacteriota bacterium]